jgi:hypothetical protein
LTKTLAKSTFTTDSVNFTNSAHYRSVDSSGYTRRLYTLQVSNMPTENNDTAFCISVSADYDSTYTLANDNLFSSDIEDASFKMTFSGFYNTEES